MLTLKPASHPRRQPRYTSCMINPTTIGTSPYMMRTSVITERQNDNVRISLGCPYHQARKNNQKAALGVASLPNVISSNNTLLAMIVRFSIDNDTCEKILKSLFCCASTMIVILFALLITYLSTFLVATESFQNMLCRISAYCILVLLGCLSGILALYSPT